MPPVHLLLIAFFAVLSMSAVPVLIKSTAANEITIGIARLLIATAAIAALAISTYGVQYLVLARIFNKERFGIAEWIAVICCFSESSRGNINYLGEYRCHHYKIPAPA